MLVSEFLTNLKRRSQYTEASTVLSDADLIAFANDELRLVIAPKLLSVRENYFVGQKDYSISGRRYRIPSRCLGSRVLKVCIVDSSGVEQHLPPQTSILNSSQDGACAFYMSEGDIVLTGTVPSGILRVYYPVRPPKMSASAAAASTISSVGATSVASTVANGTYEVIRSGSPFRTVTPALVIASNVGTDSDCSLDYTRFAAGDILITQDSTHIVPLEEELCDWLLQRTFMRMLEAFGQHTEMQAAGAKLADMEKDLLALVNPRVDNQPKVVSNKQLVGYGGWY